MKERMSTASTTDSPAVALRPVSEIDAPLFQRWSVDPETRRLQAGNRAPFTAADAEAFTRRLVEGDGKHHAAFMIEVDGRTVGNSWLANIDRDNASATLGIVMGETTSRGQGIGTEALRQILEFGFHGLHLERIELWVLAENERAVRAYERVGFRREGVRRSHIRWGAKRYDTILLAVLDRDFR